MRTNNKLRESMAQVKEIARTIYSTSDKGSSHEGLAEKIVELANAALAEPVKNCEVGTAEEQYSRMSRECHEWMCMDCKPSKDFRKCALSWAQKPYIKKEGSFE